MLKYPMAGLLLLIAAWIPAGAEPVPGPGLVRDEAQRVALAQRRGTLEELSRSVALTVYFRTGRMEVEGEMLSRIRLLGGLLREFPELGVYLDSHSDRRGSNAHNRRLSRARADFIAGVLRNEGIPAHRIHGNAWGEVRARASIDDAEGLIFDRRVEIQLSVDPEA